jgi:rubredoxin
MRIIAGRFMIMKRVRNTALEASLEHKTYMCVICGFIYEEEKGLPDDGIPPGTRWEDLPETWTCPDCGASKDDFEMIEI